MATVRLDNVRKEFGQGKVAVADASFEVAGGELLVLVGPSGCGKTTLLRIIAGLETASSGTIRIDGRTVNDVPPRERDIAMVFQNYALYPHMSVAENLAFGLKLRGTARAEIARRVQVAADMLGLGDMLERRPRQLSGGQRQRVALGALVREPKVFLLDEPLSNLDARLRLSTRVEIARLHRRLKATMIYVTHDQIEAMTLGQRIVVMQGGEIQQIDTPMRLYEQPANLFVAGFLGSPAMNFLRGRLRGDNVARLEMESIALPLGDLLRMRPELAAYEGRELVLGLRPEHLRPAVPGDASQPVLHAQLEVIEPVGNEVFLNLRFGGNEIVARVPPQDLPEHGAAVALSYSPQMLHAFDPQTGLRIAREK